MKKFLKLRIVILLFIYVIITLSLVSCMPQKKPTPPQANEEENNKPPKELDKLKESSEGIEKQLTSIYEENKKPIIIDEKMLQQGTGEQQGSSQQGNEKQSNEQSGEQQGGGEQSSTSQSKAQNISPEQLKIMLEKNEKIKRQQSTLKKFEDIKKDILELHSLWNSYEPKAVADYAQPSVISGFEGTLNKLTQNISKKDEYLSLLSAIELSRYIPDFYVLYNNEVTPELQKFKYAAKRISVLCEKDNYEAAKKTYKYMEEVWITTKPKLSKDVTPIMHKFEFALNDIKNSLEMKECMIIDAKSEVIIKLTDEFEKAIKESKKGEES